MNYTSSSYNPVNQNCQWCNQSIIPYRQISNCQHKICNKCIVNDKACQSNCPVCWYTNSARFVNDNKICPVILVCCSGIKASDRTFACTDNHNHCSQCSQQGCILCQFRQSNFWNTANYRDLPANLQHILYACHTWESKFEENQQSTFVQSNQLLNNKDSLLMEISNEAQFDSVHPQSKNNQNKPVKNEELGDCMVCLERLGPTYHTLEVCNHHFHKQCIETWFQSNGKQSCPSCGYVYGISKGPQPPNGKMTLHYLPTILSGFQNEQFGHEGPTIEIIYSFPSGTQGNLNPNPGKPYSGTTRKAYLPNTKEGKQILVLLQKAFNDQHIFTIGRSATTGQDNVITWNDIHHKTNLTGGPDRFGYPDPTYLYRVRQELADKGYK